MLKNNCGIQNMGRIGYDISKTETRLFSTSGYSSVYGELTKRGVHKMLKMVNGNNKIFVESNFNEYFIKNNINSS